MGVSALLHSSRLLRCRLRLWKVGNETVVMAGR